MCAALEAGNVLASGVVLEALIVQCVAGRCLLVLTEISFCLEM